MRVLLLFRGAPGCGKSTFIDEHVLRPYALSADEIRLQCQSPGLTVDGNLQISLKNEKTVWKMLFELLEARMQRGEFTVIDATNSKTAEMNRYKELCMNYRYRIFCIDFTNLPIEECKRRNASRIPLKRVPEAAIDKMYARFKNQKIPSGIKVISPDELDTIFIKKIDLTNMYDKIVHIGDIHGCYTALMEYFKDGFKDNYYYIFLGDFLDRGIENAEVLKFMIEASKRSNVLLLEGNHERHLWQYANDETTYSKEFEFVTKPELDGSGIDHKDIRQLYKKLGQCAWYTFHGKEVLVSHGGISTMLDNLGLIATEQLIKGVGKYDDYGKIADTWMETTSDNMYQIFGHRNTGLSDTRMRDRVFNLEGHVEFGGHLRITELSSDEFRTIDIKNDVFKPIETFDDNKEIFNSPIADVVLKLRDNKCIKEKACGNISSFNFTNRAFYDGIWDSQTITARGLYINTATMKIVARGYNKFFNIDERPETKFDRLSNVLKFPVACYVKENGYLGLVSYNSETDDLFITSKSDPEGPFAEWLRDMVNTKINETARNRLKDISRDENVTFVFESVDVEYDPHIIEYQESELYLLAIIKNDMNFEQYDYDTLVKIGNELGLTVKTKAVTLNTWQEFYDWYNDVMREDYTFDGRIVEGFVIEDASGFMIKAKLYYYKFWKHMRSVAMTTLKNGYIQKTGSLTDKLSNDFYGFLQKLYNETDVEARDNIPRDIIHLRKKFYNYYLSKKQVLKMQN